MGDGAIVPVFKIDADVVAQVMNILDDVHAAAAAIAVNRTGEIAMYEQRGKVENGRFHIRNPRFDVPPVTIPGPFRATPDHLAATIGLTYPTDDPHSIGSRADAVFGKFGASQTVEANTPLMPFFAPTEALRASPSAVIPRSKYPQQMVGIFDANGNFRGLGRKARIKSVRRRGSRGILGQLAQAAGMIGPRYIAANKPAGKFFMIGNPGDPFFGIWQRTGQGRGDIQELWMFLEHKHIPRLLDFEADMMTSFGAHWEQVMSDALDAALAGKLPAGVMR